MQLSGKTVEAMRQFIVDGTWPVGSKIPTEPALADLLDVGRNTVREAVQSLVHAGLVEKRQGSGTYVVSQDELGPALHRHLGHVSHSDALEARRAIEVEAAWLASQRATESAKIALTMAARELHSLVGDAVDHQHLGRPDVVAADLAFHRALVAASGNSLLLTLHDNLADAIRENIQINLETASQSPERAGELQGTHDAIMHAVIQGDGTGAMDAVRLTLARFLDTAEPDAPR
ncbi:FadR/GntR family transcriptional regulator [Rarobacter incanus]|nr:FadR/GntR family transcriptional regulator [Rarobacter incanus]